MQSRFLLSLGALCCAAPIHGQSADPVFRSGFEQSGALTANWQANLDVHNQLRSSVVPAAMPALPPMQWNQTLAAVAQAHADRCVFAHSANGYGENIYASTGFVTGEADAAIRWAQEAGSYDHASNSCAIGQVCGHYTQMAWRSSTDLGCGIRECRSGSPWGGGDWTVVVCNYHAPGNWGGQRPY